MTLNIMEQFTAKNYTPAARVPATWGIGPRTITSITIHWWGTPVGQTFEGIVDWFCNPQSSVGTSAHYVASAGQVACIVSPEDAAWHAGAAEGNVHSIGIECNPRCSDGDYQSIAELVAWIRANYGDLPLYAHNHWTQTTCPGDYRLNRIDALARGGAAPAATTITPIKDYLDMVTKEDWDNLVKKVDNLPAAVLLTTMKRNGQDGKADGTVTTLRDMAINYNQINERILGHLNAPTTAPETGAQVDVNALAAQLSATLGPAVAAELAKRLTA